MVERQPSKLYTGVRFSSLALNIDLMVYFFYLGMKQQDKCPAVSFRE